MYNICHINNIFLAAHNSYRLNLFLHCYVMWRELACVFSLSKYQHNSKRIQMSPILFAYFWFYLCTKCRPLHGFLSEKPHQKRRNMTTSTRSEASSLDHHLSGQPPGLSGGPCPAQGSFGLGWRSPSGGCLFCTVFLIIFERVFKKSSSNGRVTLYLGRRDFVDHVTGSDPVDGVLLVERWKHHDVLVDRW